MTEIRSKPKQQAFRLDWFDWIVLGAVGVLSIAVLGPLLITGHSITGGDGLFPPDQLQYLSWIRQAADHGLIGNRFDFAPDTRVFLHPAFLISGLAVRLGLPIQYSNALIWKPVAVLVVFFGARQYARRLLPSGWPARTGTVLALFTLVPASTILGVFGAGFPLRYNLDFITSEMWPGQQLLGYEVAASAIFLVPLTLLLAERAKRERSWGKVAAVAGLALLITWLQPWQGAELLIILAAVEFWRWWRADERPFVRFVAVALAGIAPAVYYAILERTDPFWKLYGEMNRANADPIWNWSWWAVLLCLAPLGVPAIASVRSGIADWQTSAVRFWPVAVLIVYLQPSGTFPFHSVQGLSVPLAVMAVQGFTIYRPTWLPRPRIWWVVPAVAFLIVPGTWHRLGLAHENVQLRRFPYYFVGGEKAALSWLAANPREGGVLADRYAGLLVPPFANRESYVGPRVLTPGFKTKATDMDLLLLRFMKPQQAQAFVASTGASFIFEACGAWKGGAPALGSLLAPVIESERRFGCARVYSLKPTRRSTRLAAELGNG